MFQTILALIMLHGAKGHIPAKELAAEIIVQASIHKLDPVMVTRIIMVESRGLEHAYNAKSRDLGIGQINIVVAQEMKLDSKCLFNWKCNLKHAIIIMARKRSRLPCAYNLGFAGAADPEKKELCLTYARKVASIKLKERK